MGTINTALLLAAGKGTRLGSTEEFPKPMNKIPIKTVADTKTYLEEKPVIDYIIDQVKEGSEVKSLVVVLGFGREVLEGHIQKIYGDQFNLIFPDKKHIGEYIYQTMIGVRDYLPENFLMLNTDIYSNLDLSQLAQDHLKNYENGILYTLATTYLHKGAEKCGILEGVEPNNPKRTIGFLPKGHGRDSGWIDTGFVAPSQNFIDYLERITSKNKDLGYHDARLALSKEGLVDVSIQPDCFWFDIGTPDDYLSAKDHSTNLRVKPFKN